MSLRFKQHKINWRPSDILDLRLRSWSEQVSAPNQLLGDEPLSRHSSLRIGGPARHWLEVADLAALENLLAALGGASFCCVGLGSNTLFPDEGIADPVVRMVDELATWSVEVADDAQSAKVIVGAGAINAHLVRGLLRQGWVGAEFLTLIPGTFGGAVALNAGTKEQELAAILDGIWLALKDEQNQCWHVDYRSPEQLAMSYRHAELPDGALVLGGVLRLQKGDVEAARERVKADKQRRNRTQPYRLASVGSTFANPDGDYAGRLIEEVGLKGTAIGGAKISELHANFFINTGEARADDFLSLMALARRRVRQRFDVELRPEVRFVGFDGYARMRDLEQALDDRDV